jgi:hypothetical protein
MGNYRDNVLFVLALLEGLVGAPRGSLSVRMRSSHTCSVDRRGEMETKTLNQLNCTTVLSLLILIRNRLMEVLKEEAEPLLISNIDRQGVVDGVL